jgi:hypothetical protein
MSKKQTFPGLNADYLVEEYSSPSPALGGYSSYVQDSASPYPYPYPDDNSSILTPRTIFYHPRTQVVLLGFVCFMCPGLFNALNGLGAGGQVDSTTSANANSTLYATFALAAFFAGSVYLHPPHSFED